MATITGSGVLVGTAGNDAITGDTTNDVLVGHGGSDTLNGGDGDDILAPDTSIYLISDGYPYNAERYWGSADDGAVDHVDGGGGFDRVAMRFDESRPTSPRISPIRRSSRRLPEARS